MRNPHASLPFTATEMRDDSLAAALADVSVPTLLLSCVHPTGAARVRARSDPDLARSRLS